MAIKCPACNADNPETQKFCGDCGTQLPTPPGHPPALTETLQTPVRELTTGSTFASRYQVIEELGHGGMGKVYKVFDTDIKEKIALKLLRPEIALDKETIERFSNELKLARKIRHKNICGMFDLGKAEGTTFITMEFVPGEDLKKLIRKTGQLGAGRAVSIAKQVCEGLAEAHHFGVIHRDLKPQNIMVDEDGNARIMDFGIARSLSTRGITGPGVMIGTPEYMSPEQVEGKEVDQRSDIYSLGVILFEMVTGRVPFEGDTPLTIAVKHKSERPKNPRELNGQIPEDLSRLVLRCLEKDKAKRYQTAEELHADLDRVQTGLPTTERIVAKRRPMTSKQITVTFSARKLIIPVIALLALVAVGLVFWQVSPSRRAPMMSSASAMPTLAVLYFENTSGDAKLDNWRDVLAEWLIADLQQSKLIRVISGEEMFTVLKRLGLAETRKYSSEDIDKIALQCRATHILRGSYIKIGESFIITAGLQKTGATESPTALRLEASNEKDIIAKVDELTRQVKEGLNLTANQIASDVEEDAGKVTTSSPEALRYYIEGRRIQLMKIDWQKVIPYMEKAVEIDPEFALAYRLLGIAHRTQGHYADFQKYYNRAVELSARLPENERLFIQGQFLALNENYTKAIETLEKLVKDYPGNMAGHFTLADAYWAVEDFDNAILHYQLAVQILRTAIVVGNLSYVYSEKGLYQKAEDVCRSYIQDVEDNAYVREALYRSYLERRQFDLALADAEKLYLLDPSYKAYRGEVLFCKGDFAGAESLFGDDYRWKRNLLLARGRLRETIELAQKELDKSKGDKAKEAGALSELAFNLWKNGLNERAYQALVQCYKLRDELRAESGEPFLPSQQEGYLAWKGLLQAEMGSFEEAQRTAGELKTLIEKGINKNESRDYERILGKIELGKKNYRQASDLFGRACSRLDSAGDTSFSDLLARALFECGDLDKSRENYEKITMLTTGRLDHGDIYAKAFYMLGKVAEKQGDKARARENYQKFLDLWKDADPGLPEVDDAKARLAGLK